MMTESARVKIDPAFAIGEIDPRLYGGFVEHMGRCVYTGIYEPEHASADADGFRGDVADLVRGLHMPVMRYPGATSSRNTTGKMGSDRVSNGPPGSIWPGRRRNRMRSGSTNT